MRGIVLAGGTGTRLWPITKTVSKQLLPVYDKPMIYYPLSTLMLAGIRDILIITTPHDVDAFKSVLKDGSEFGIKLTYETQEKPEGIAQALIIGEDFLEDENCLLILGDNIFHGTGLGSHIKNVLPSNGAHIFTYEVSNSEQYGILTIDSHGLPVKIEEKPINSLSSLAVTGLYFFDNQASTIAKNSIPSARGELEITSIIQVYLDANQLSVTHLSRGTAWLDTGNPNSLHDASTYIRVIEERTSLKIGCLEEIALNNNWISAAEIKSVISKNGNNHYSRYLKALIEKRENDIK
jgi:glucose-1-phosphate thymidylyltransferase